MDQIRTECHTCHSSQHNILCRPLAERNSLPQNSFNLFYPIKSVYHERLLWTGMLPLPIGRSITSLCQKTNWWCVYYFLTIFHKSTNPPKSCKLCKETFSGKNVKPSYPTNVKKYEMSPPVHRYSPSDIILIYFCCFASSNYCDGLIGTFSASNLALIRTSQTLRIKSLCEYAKEDLQINKSL